MNVQSVLELTSLTCKSPEEAEKGWKGGCDKEEWVFRAWSGTIRPFQTKEKTHTHTPSQRNVHVFPKGTFDFGGEEPGVAEHSFELA